MAAELQKRVQAAMMRNPNSLLEQPCNRARRNWNDEARNAENPIWSRRLRNTFRYRRLFSACGIRVLIELRLHPPL